MERHFSRELDELRGKLVAMSRAVDEQLDAAYRSLLDGSEELAKTVIAGDVRVNDYDTLIDAECQRILALTQPVAIDLRLLMAALQINHELERIGDIAVNVAERAIPLVPHRQFVRSTRLADMAEIARIMVRDSFDAFLHNDPRVAMRVLDSDDVVDKLDRDLFRHLVGVMEKQHNLIQPASHLLILSRHLERLADHATNIAEDVIFLVNARVVKHNAPQNHQP